MFKESDDCIPKRLLLILRFLTDDRIYIPDNSVSSRLILVGQIMRESTRPLYNKHEHE